METLNKYKRGDLSPCGELRFWAYLSHVRKDGRKSERWVPAKAFDRYKKQDRERSELTEARRQFIRDQRAKPKIDPREYLWKTYGIK